MRVDNVTTTDGTRLSVLVWPHDGPGGPPFLLVHGLASNCRTWEEVGDLLAAAGHPVAAVDQRGHGRSDKPDAGYDFATLCADLIDVIDGLGYDRPVVVGQSTGGNIAVELGRRAGERLAGVAGVDGGALELADQWPEWEDCVRALAPPELSGVRATDMEHRIRSAHPSWSERGVAATMANYRTLADGTVRAWLSFDRHLAILRSLWEHRPSQVFPELRTALLLALADTGDDWVPAKRVEAAKAERLAPRCRVHWFSPADHDIHVERPAELARLLHAACVDGFFAP
ncbi:MAG: alpha/beta hydrolase [Actinomycetota bacterium]|nr:alpha/beta hydrolase [Actinomycetota bacterium]